jgi:hypothetical protein
VSKPNLPTVIEVMAEYGPFLWNRSPDQDPFEDDYVVDPAALGISPGLIARLDAWNVEWGRRALGLGITEASPGTAEWGRTGLRLAYQLQAEFDALGHDIDVRYAHDDDPRPLRERRGR